MKTRKLAMFPLSALFFGFLSVVPPPCQGGVFITEWMYNGIENPPGGGLEFIEFTNLGSIPVDMTGWSFDDSSQTPGQENLSGFGMVQPGESVIFAEASAETFRTAWGLNESVKVVGGNTNNLSRSDEVNLYDANSQLVDRLTYNDAGTPNTIRTQFVSGNPQPDIWQTVVGVNNFPGWVLSSVGDVYGSYASTVGDLGNPGKFTPSAAAHPGDFDTDGDVDGADFVAWQTNFPKGSGASLNQGDADGDGDVDGADFVVWQTNFPFTPAGGVAAVPEPDAIVLLAMGAAGLALGLQRRMARRSPSTPAKTHSGTKTR